MRADNSIHLTTAARRRHENTRAKAIAALHELDHAGAVLTFESVARHAGVSRSWLYTQTDIKDEIHRLRDLNHPNRHPTPPRNEPATPPCDSVSRSRNRRNRELADENQRLRRQLACALGQLRENGRTRPADSPAHRSSVTIGPR